MTANTRPLARVLSNTKPARRRVLTSAHQAALARVLYLYKQDVLMLGSLHGQASQYLAGLCYHIMACLLCQLPSCRSLSSSHCACMAVGSSCGQQTLSAHRPMLQNSTGQSMHSGSYHRQLQTPPANVLIFHLSAHLVH